MANANTKAYEVISGQDHIGPGQGRGPMAQDLESASGHEATERL